MTYQILDRQLFNKKPSQKRGSSSAYITTDNKQKIYETNLQPIQLWQIIEYARR